MSQSNNEEDDYKLKNRNMVLNFGEKGDEEEGETKQWQPSSGSSGSGNSTPHGQNLIGKDINFDQPNEEEEEEN